MFKRILAPRPFSIDIAILILRLAAGCLLITHGWAKASSFNERLTKFADPIGLGSELSFTLAVFAEFFCSLFVIAGLFTRYALIPIMINMTVIVFIVHANDPFNRQELPLLYLFCFVTLFLAGQGRYSLDILVGKSSRQEPVGNSSRQ